MIRINKFIAESGITSRRKAEEFIRQGRVIVNGKVVTDLSSKIDPYNDTVFVDDTKLKPKEKVYFLLNKPRGVITSTSDDKNRRTVVDLINSKEKIFPVGRLDYNTTGLLLLTNDGDFSNQLTHPSYKVDRVYITHLDQDLKSSDKDKLLKGIFLDNRRSKFTQISFVEEKNFRIVKVVTVEGRNHFVKNMFSYLGYKVRELQRESFGKFNIKGLQLGEYKVLTKQNIKKLIK